MSTLGWVKKKGNAGPCTRLSYRTGCYLDRGGQWEPWEFMLSSPNNLSNGYLNKLLSLVPFHSTDWHRPSNHVIKN